MELDTFMLSRIQFAANITFHILFPAITIALGWFLLFFKIRFYFTNNSKWMECYFFFTKIFALCFALGVVSGITMSFQFGTNWPGFMLKVGNIAGPLLAYEVLTAFFLEATFLGIMLFGFRRVPPWLHNLATFLVAFGTTLSAFWILVLNSWMQTPAGFEIVDGIAHATSWFDIIFNPSMPYRMLHMLIASGITAAFFIAGISAYRWLKNDRVPSVLSALKTAVYTAAVLVPLQIVIGDLHGLNTLKHQPQKVAAMEGLWETTHGAPLVLFGLPNEKTKRNDYALEIPKLGSLILTHSWDGEVKGLKDFPNNHPPVSAVFWSFRIMVGVGVIMLLIAWATTVQLYRKKNIGKSIAYTLTLMTFSGWVATLAGWYTTEIGRQPWLVNGVLRVSDAVTKTPAPMIKISLISYLAIYIGLIIAFTHTIFYIARHAHDKKKSLRGAVIEETLNEDFDDPSHTK